MTYAWLLAVTTACVGDQVVIEVDTNGLDVATVELVIADAVCQEQGDDCRAVQGDGFAFKVGRPGDLFVRDASAISDNVASGTVAFEVPSEGGLIPMAFAIGRSADTTIIGSAVMASTIDRRAGRIRYRVTLDPTDDLRQHNKMSGVAAAAQWGDANQCIGVEPVRSSLEIQRPLFILPKDDPDCDGRGDDQECDPLWFDGISIDESIATHCVATRNQDITQPCLLGHVPTCVENTMAKNPSCLPSETCLPGVLCTACLPLDEECQQTKLQSLTGEVRIDCNPPGNIDGTGTTTACDSGGSTPNEFVLLPLNAALASATCTDVRLVETPNASFHSTLGDLFTVANATFEIAQVDADCAVRLRWGGSFETGGIAHTVIVFTIEVDDQTREVWVPINFHIGTIGCGNTSTCAYIDSNDEDTILKCALP